MKKLWRSAATYYGKSGELKNLRCLADVFFAELQEMAICGRADRECFLRESCAKTFFKVKLIDYRKLKSK